MLDIYNMEFRRGLAKNAKKNSTSFRILAMSGQAHNVAMFLSTVWITLSIRIATLYITLRHATQLVHI